MKILCTSDRTANPKLPKGQTYEIDPRRDILRNDFGGLVVAYYIHGRSYHADQFRVVEG